MSFVMISGSGVRMILSMYEAKSSKNVFRETPDADLSRVNDG